MRFLWSWFRQFTTIINKWTYPRATILLGSSVFIPKRPDFWPNNHE